MMVIKLVLLLLSATYLHGSVQAPVTANLTTQLTITVPTDDTKLEFDGIAIPGTGRSRTFETPPLAIDRSYQYKVIAKWTPNSYTNMTRTKDREAAGRRATEDRPFDRRSGRSRGGALCANARPHCTGNGETGRRHRGRCHLRAWLR